MTKMHFEAIIVIDISLDCSQSPFFREIVETQRVLPLMAAILIFKCTEGTGVEDYSSNPNRLAPAP